MINQSRSSGFIKYLILSLFSLSTIFIGSQNAYSGCGISTIKAAIKEQGVEFTNFKGDVHSLFTDSTLRKKYTGGFYRFASVFQLAALRYSPDRVHVIVFPKTSDQKISTEALSRKMFHDAESYLRNAIEASKTDTTGEVAHNLSFFYNKFIEKVGKITYKSGREQSLTTKDLSREDVYNLIRTIFLQKTKQSTDRLGDNLVFEVGKGKDLGSFQGKDSGSIEMSGVNDFISEIMLEQTIQKAVTPEFLSTTTSPERFVFTTPEGRAKFERMLSNKPEIQEKLTDKKPDIQEKNTENENGIVPYSGEELTYSPETFKRSAEPALLAALKNRYKSDTVKVYANGDTSLEVKSDGTYSLSKYTKENATEIVNILPDADKNIFHVLRTHGFDYPIPITEHAFIQNILKTNKIIDIIYDGRNLTVLKDNGSVVTKNLMASPTPQTDVSYPASELQSGVVKIFGYYGSHAALKKGGSVVTWGNSKTGGDSSAVADQLKSGVVDLFHNGSAWLAVKKDGSLVTWGNPSKGGQLSPSITRIKSKITQVLATSWGFVVLTKDGTMIDTVTNDSITGVEKMVLTYKQNLDSVVTALRKDGSLVTWGAQDPVAAQLTSGVKDIFATGNATIALRKDGSVVTWGDERWGGYSPHIADRLSGGVEKIVTNGIGAAALKKDGSVVTWGENKFSIQEDQLSSDVIDIFADNTGFTATKKDGSRFSWSILAN